MKRFISLIFTALFCAAMLSINVFASEHNAKAMIIYEPRTGTILAEANAEERMLIASTTKIMTAMLVIEHCDMDEQVLVTDAHLAVEGSSARLCAGENYSVYELLCGLLLASGNDAAMALAEHTAGSVENFAALMNQKCTELGLANTHFSNPHGLDDAAHYSSAHDLAIITAAAMESEIFSEIFSLKSCHVHGVTYSNHNKLLTDYQDCIGGKTGYTKAAGRVLVSCAERGDLRLICVTIDDPDDWKDHKNLYDNTFASWRYLQLPAAEWSSVAVISGNQENAALSCSLDGVVLPAEAEIQMDVELPSFVFAPLQRGQVLGRVTVFADDNMVLSTEILAAEDCLRDDSVPLKIGEKIHRGWKMYCRYGMNMIYPPIC